jgi:large subunit ribosomal protein L15
MQIQNVIPKTKSKRHKTVGRGGKRGKTSGRGTKGQNARAGRKKRPEIRDIIKKLPKNRGYKFKSITPKPAIITLTQLEKIYVSKETVSPTSLAEKGISVRHGGALNRVKILSTGELTKALTFSRCIITPSAKVKIEKAGGTIL